MKNVTIVMTMLATSAALAVATGACGGSGSTDVPKGDTSPSTPSGNTSGAPSTSGAMTSGGTSGTNTSGGTSGATSGGTSGTTSGGTADASTDAPGANCVPMGYAGNDKKVGAYCDKDVSCPFQVSPFLVCTYGHDPTNTHLFCTSPCSADSECGTGAYCMHDTAGSGCVPTQCGGMPGM
ncbi:MAG: hypothetical protein JWO86_5622 [Myxococcaceae bacterium]|nr:hypothetical protein [Myxococcaceae bacterium]MEA2747055.1 hypothetical protein [Myxococcales bacterium]